MKKFDRALEMDVAKEMIDDTMAEFIRYFNQNNIDENADRNNPISKAFFELLDMRKNKVYACETKKEFDEIIKKANEMKGLIRV